MTYTYDFSETNLLIDVLIYEYSLPHGTVDVTSTRPLLPLVT